MSSLQEMSSSQSTDERESPGPQPLSEDPDESKDNKGLVDPSDEDTEEATEGIVANGDNGTDDSNDTGDPEQVPPRETITRSSSDPDDDGKATVVSEDESALNVPSNDCEPHNHEATTTTTTTASKTATAATDAAAEATETEATIATNAAETETATTTERKATQNATRTVATEKATKKAASKIAATGDWMTLPQSPDGESGNRNCWSEPPVDRFQVRGPNYLVDKKKVTSEPFLLRARGCDLFDSKDPPINVGVNPAILDGALRTVPTFLFSFRFPWGVLVLYFEIPKRFCPFLLPGAKEKPPSMEGMSSAETALAKFFMADEAQKNASLKLIPYVTEGPWIVRNMVTGKPAIIGNKLPVTYTYEPAKDGMAEYLEADLDVGSSSATAKRIVSVCRRSMSALTLDIGFVVQGNSEDELPEQMLGSLRIHRVDPAKAPSI